MVLALTNSPLTSEESHANSKMDSVKKKNSNMHGAKIW